MNTLRNILVAAGSAAILAGMATAASAQSTASDSATVNASIIQPVAILFLYFLTKFRYHCLRKQQL